MTRVPGGVGSPADKLFAAAMRSHKSGQLAAAEEQYRRALAVDPTHADSLYCLGIVALQTGRGALAVDVIRKALARNERQPDWHYHLGVAYQMVGQSEAAAAHYSFAVTLNPRLADAHANLGLIAMQQGRSADAMVHLQRALNIDPNHSDAQNNVANLYAASGDVERAADIYRRIIQRNPRYREAYENLARTLVAAGQPAQAIAILTSGFRIGVTPGMKNLFVTCAQGVRASTADPGFRDLLLRAMSEPWGRPGELAAVGASIIAANAEIAACIDRAVNDWPRRLPLHDLFGPRGMAAAAQDGLLLCLLESCPVTDARLERFLTAARSALLELAAAPSGELDEHAIKFFAALARQCFINEYVFAELPEERERMVALRDAVGAALAGAVPVSECELLAIAAFMPLHTVRDARKLLERPWSNPMRALLVQQIIEPQQEAEIRASFAQLTPIDDGVSQAVRQQYEQNPYPRWIKAPPAVPLAGFDDYLRNHFPTAPFHGLGKDGHIDILVAGCGTGLPAIELAQNFPRATILAVDLSRASLAYAQRKSRELRLDTIEYAQADILGLGSIGRSFDVIDVSGVLHHMAQPFAGWRTLLSLLRPRGFMHIGLYSERARQDVAAARAVIVEQGCGQTADDIRQFRQELMRLDDASPLKALLRSGDFFSTSPCRDLLFHVQEHRFSLPQIKEFLSEHRLRLLGFNLPDATLHRYATRYPADKTMTDLDLWHAFETENRYTFIGMYQFWVQREG